jgi:hypothetical protein
LARNSPRTIWTVRLPKASRGEPLHAIAETKATSRSANDSRCPRILTDAYLSAISVNMYTPYNFFVFIYIFYSLLISDSVEYAVLSRQYWLH